ncbi:hypothetical protein TeGR_g11064 [Tetraparma gracilis]|uniref:JmjC domain-containing protein n=1 Tax=Tetraparma gracilis TaxID=2962635 RepID=A0ABQ6MY55_9STRA|nr:hypothetical protein TeGR_g11064 [Tetraparma gracilis]
MGLASSLSLSLDPDLLGVSLSRGGGPPVRYRDNVVRTPFVEGETFEASGDDLPTVPAVLVGCCKGQQVAGWSVPELAARCGGRRFEVDGGPGRARRSMAGASVTLKDFEGYASRDGDGDDAPLYIFDYRCLTSPPLQSEFSVPSCFSRDLQACITGSKFRPLPPAWLLVGSRRSGTPWHNHPTTVAWNYLASGAKLWMCMPPEAADAQSGAFEGLPEAGGDDLDLAAAECFLGWRQPLPAAARVIVQREGETVFLPAGWWHVVLNVEEATAISCSLALGRDVERLWGELEREDPEMAAFWRRAMDKEGNK